MTFKLVTQNRWKSLKTSVAPVVQKADNFIQQLSRYPTN